MLKLITLLSYSLRFLKLQPILEINLILMDVGIGGDIQPLIIQITKDLKTYFSEIWLKKLLDFDEF